MNAIAISVYLEDDMYVQLMSLKNLTKYYKGWKSKYMLTFILDYNF